MNGFQHSGQPLDVEFLIGDGPSIMTRSLGFGGEILGGGREKRDLGSYTAGGVVGQFSDVSLESVCFCFFPFSFLVLFFFFLSFSFLFFLFVCFLFLTFVLTSFF